uniref:Chromo domain-containing protein n=1 Tax=Cyprinus carpio carpio TaxID=630221 RepID=A0A9J8B1D5_CYPCA
FRESERVWDSAHIHLQCTIRRHKAFADVRRAATPVYQPGDKVWLSTRDLRLRQQCRKLSHCYIGPFTVERQINEVTYRLQLPPRYRIHPSFHVSLLKPFSASTTDSPEPQEPPPLEILEQPSIYQVKEILNSQRQGARLEYLVDWEGYRPDEHSWVAKDDILDPMLHRQHPDHPAPRGRGCPRHRVRASGAAPGGGGNVRNSPSQPPLIISRALEVNLSTTQQHLVTETLVNKLFTCTKSSVSIVVRDTETEMKSNLIVLNRIKNLIWPLTG